MAADTISYVTPTGTLTWTRVNETAALGHPELLADGYLFGPTPLTSACREIIETAADSTTADPVEVRYGYWYEFTADASTLPDVLAAMLLTGPGHLDTEGWDILAEHLATVDDDTPGGDGESIRIR